MVKKRSKREGVLMDVPSGCGNCPTDKRDLNSLGGQTLRLLTHVRAMMHELSGKTKLCGESGILYLGVES
jgi:hypothetical protein